MKSTENSGASYFVTLPASLVEKSVEFNFDDFIVCSCREISKDFFYEKEFEEAFWKGYFKNKKMKSLLEYKINQLILKAQRGQIIVIFL